MENKVRASPTPGAYSAIIFQRFIIFSFTNVFFLLFLHSYIQKEKQFIEVIAASIPFYRVREFATSCLVIYIIKSSVGGGEIAYLFTYYEKIRVRIGVRGTISFNDFGYNKDLYVISPGYHLAVVACPPLAISKHLYHVTSGNKPIKRPRNKP